MTLLALVVILSWIWMMATALHLDDVRTESPHSSSLPAVQRQSRGRPGTPESWGAGA